MRLLRFASLEVHAVWCDRVESTLDSGLDDRTEDGEILREDGKPFDYPAEQVIADLLAQVDSLIAERASLRNERDALQSQNDELRRKAGT